MTEKSLQELKSEFWNSLTENPNDNIIIIKNFFDNYKDHPHIKQLLREFAQELYGKTTIEKLQKIHPTPDPELQKHHSLVETALKLASEHKTREAIDILEPTLQWYTQRYPYEVSERSRGSFEHHNVINPPLDLTLVYGFLGRMYQELDLYEEAKNAHEIALRYCPTNTDNHLHLAYCYYRLHDPSNYDKCTRQAYAYATTTEEFATCYANFATLLLDNGEIDSAATIFKYSEYYEKLFRVKKLLEFIELEFKKSPPKPTSQDIEHICKSNNIPFDPNFLLSIQ